jgi:hypothetical protein
MSFWVAGAVVGSAVIGGIASSNAASKQAGASEAATAAQRDALAKQTELNRPFYEAGLPALNRLQTQQDYTPESFNYQEDPGYAFRFNEGMKGLNASAAARGGLISGNALRAATDYGQASGSQEYQNSYNRYLANNAQRLQAYNTNTANQQYLANVGQSSANNQANQIGNFGNAAAGNMIGAANAGAAGNVGVANALTSGVGTYLNYNQNQNMLNAFNNRNMSAYANQYGSNNIYGGGGTGTIPSTVDPFIG